MIKILFLAANPKDTDHLRLDEEVRTIKERLRAAEHRDSFQIEQEWAVRVGDIQQHLLIHKPDIVHFSGHGSDVGEIILEDQSGMSKAVSPQSLKRLFKVLKDNIHCVVLNACFSKVQADAIAESIDYVVGMSNSIGDKAAISFAAGFYQALGFDRSITEAFELGCSQIELEGLSEEDTPKLITVAGVNLTASKSIEDSTSTSTHKESSDRSFNLVHSIYEKIDSVPLFYFTLEGEAAKGNCVVLGSDVDLVFKYDFPSQDILVEVLGEKLNRIRKQNVDLGIAVVGKGFSFSDPDKTWYKKAKFREGRMVEPVRFNLKAADEPVNGSGFYISFDVRGYVLYQFHLAVHLVSKDAIKNIVSSARRVLDLDLDLIITEEEEAEKAMRMSSDE
jgi:hypothetical protein